MDVVIGVCTWNESGMDLYIHVINIIKFSKIRVTIRVTEISNSDWCQDKSVCWRDTCIVVLDLKKWKKTLWILPQNWFAWHFWELPSHLGHLTIQWLNLVCTVLYVEDFDFILSVEVSLQYSSIFFLFSYCFMASLTSTAHLRVDGQLPYQLTHSFLHVCYQ